MTVILAAWAAVSVWGQVDTVVQAYPVHPAQAGDIERLENFVRNAKTGHAEFT